MKKNLLRLFAAVVLCLSLSVSAHAVNFMAPQNSGLVGSGDSVDGNIYSPSGIIVDASFTPWWAGLYWMDVLIDTDSGSAGYNYCGAMGPGGTGEWVTVYLY